MQQFNLAVLRKFDCLFLLIKNTSRDREVSVQLYILEPTAVDELSGVDKSIVRLVEARNVLSQKKKRMK